MDIANSLLSIPHFPNQMVEGIVFQAADDTVVCSENIQSKLLTPFGINI